MLHVTLSGLWARKRRLFGTSLAVVLGVGFLAATLLLGDTLTASFDGLFRQANAGTAVVVRSRAAIGSGGDEDRGTIDRRLADVVARVPGVGAVAAEVDGPAQLLGADGKAVGGGGPPTLGASWVADPRLNPYRLVAGHAPRHDGEVVVDADSARAAQLAVGDRATVRTPTPISVRVTGIVHFGDRSSMLGATYVGFTDHQAAAVLGRPGQASELVVASDGSRSDAALRAAVAAVLPHQAEAITGAERTAEQQRAIQGDFLGFVKAFLLAFAGIALVVATFSIHNTFTILLAQRTRESALLRALGASRRQVLTAVGVEAVAIGAGASAVGLAAGLGLGRGLEALLAHFGLDLPGGLVVRPASLVAAAAVGVVVTVVASAAPAVRASRVAPVEAMRAAATESGRPSRLRTGAGLLATLGGAATVAMATHASAPLARASLGALLLLVGVVALGPTLARPAAALLGRPVARLRGQPGRLARLNAMRNPRRTAASALALVVGTAVVALLATFGASLRHSIDQTVSRSFGGDLVITQDSFSSGAVGGVSPDVGTEVAKLPEVAHSVALANATATVDGATVQPTAADPARLAAVIDLDDHAGSMAKLADGEVAVSQRYADDHHLRLGSSIRLRFLDGTDQAFRVGDVYGVGDLMGDLVMTTHDWAPHVTHPGDVAVLVGLRHGVSLDQGRRAVERVTDRNGTPTVEDRQQYIDRTAGQVDQLLALAYGLLALAVVIALMGIANTLSLSIHERGRELGLLRAVGLTRRRLRATVRWESVITAVIGTVIGLALGTFLGWGMVRAMATTTTFLRFAAPVGTLVAVLVLAVAAGVVAAVRPARRAARLDVLAAIGDR